MRRSCSRRSTNRPTPSPRRSPTAPHAATAWTWTRQDALDEAMLADVKRVVVVACGTSYHAGLIGRYAIEEWARLPVEMDIASEYRYRNPVVGPGDLVIGISQSGETADTLAAMRLARERGATVLAITNVMGSQATREADGVLFTRAGLEIGVAATKTFLCQVAVTYLLGLRLAELRGTLTPQRLTELVGEIKRLPHCIDEVLGARWASRSARSPSPLAERVLPVHRPPRRSSGCAGGGAEAEGDLLHRNRRLRRRGDEARSDRAARRVDAGGLRGDGLAGAREARVEHRRRCARAVRSVIAITTDGNERIAAHADAVDQAAGGGLDAPADARRHPPAAARLRDRAATRVERRPAAQPGEDRHGRVARARDPARRLSPTSWRRGPSTASGATI